MRLLAFLLCFLPGVALAQEGGNFFTRFIEDSLSGENRNVTINGFEGALSSRASIEELTVSDDEGVWLIIRDAVLDWNRSALLRGRIEVSELTAEEVLLPRGPVSTGDDLPSPEAQPFSLPELPVAIRIDRLAVDRVVLGEPLVGEEAELSVEGAVQLAGGDGNVQLDIVRTDGPEARLNLDAQYSNETEALALSLELAEGEGGIVSRLLGLPDQPALQLTLEGDGTLQDFGADLQLVTDGEERLAGRITLVTEADAAGEPLRRYSADVSGDIAPLFAPDYREFFGPEIALQTQGQIEADGRIELSELELTAQALTLNGEVVIGADGLPERVDITGRIGTEGDAPVLLPIRPRTQVQAVDLALTLDDVSDDGWQLRLEVLELERESIAFDALRLTGEGRIERESAAGGRLVAGTIRYAAEGIDPRDPALSRALGADVSGEAEFSWSDDDNLNLPRFSLQGEDYGLSGSAVIAGLQEALRITGDITAQLGDIARLSELAGRPLSGAATAEIEGSFAPLSGEFDVIADVTGQDLSLDQAELDRLLAGESRITLSANRDTEGTRIRNLTARASTLSAEAEGFISSTETDLAADLEFADLSVLGEQYGGSLSATANVTQDEGGVQRITAQAVGEDLSIGQPEVDRLLAGESTINLVATRDDDVTVIEELDVNAATLNANVSGTIQEGVADLAARLGFTDLSVLGPEYGGALTATAQLTQDEDGVQRVVAEAVGEDISVGQPQVDRLLSGESAVNLIATRDEGLITIEELDVEAATLSANVSGTLEEGVADLAARLGITDLSVLGPEYGGALTATAQLTQDEDGVQRVVVEAVGEDILVGQPQVDRLLSGESTVNLIATRDEGLITIEDLDLEAATLSANVSGTLEEGVADLAARLGITDLSVLGPEYGGALTATAQLTQDEDGVQRVVAEAEGEGLAIGQPQVDRLLSGESTASLIATRDGEEIVIEELEVDAATLSASATGILAEGASEIAATLGFTDLSVLGPGYGGSLSAEATYSETGTARRVQLEATGQGLQVGKEQANRLLRGETELALNVTEDEGRIQVDLFNLSNPQITVEATGNEEGDVRTVDLNARLADLGLLLPEFSGPVTVSGQIVEQENYRVDLTAQGPGGINAQVSGTAASNFETVDLDITGSMQAALANLFIEPRSVSGPISFDLEVNGSPELASVSGSVTGQGLRVVDPELGMTLEQGALRADISGGEARLNASGTLGDGGQVQITGPIGLEAPFPANLTLRLRAARLEDPELYETTVSGDVTITGPLTGGGRIAGTLALGETNLRIPSTGFGGAGYIPDEITHLNEPAAVRATRERAGLVGDGGGNGGGGTGAPPFELDVLISAPNQVFIRGRGLDAELGGEIRLSGTTANIIPIGEFSLIRGRLDILGQRFTLDEGVARLQGEFVPYIRLMASTVTDGVTATIVVEGEANDPEISFVSSPDLPEEEVLARLLFGRGLTNLSPLQAAQLASAVATLAGQGGEGIVGRLRQTFGLDDLDITTDAEGETGVRLGRYLSDNLYTDVTVGSDGDAEINLNLDVSPSVTVRGRLDSEGQTGVGVYYERDY